jgi:hypothetical protein
MMVISACMQFASPNSTVACVGALEVSVLLSVSSPVDMQLRHLLHCQPICYVVDVAHRL